MAILSFSQIIELNNLIENNGINNKVHLHDACGGQFFSFEKMQNDEYSRFKQIISEFVSGNGGTVAFMSDDKSFIIK